MTFLDPLVRSADQCMSYVEGACKYINTPSVVSRVVSGISHPQSRCDEVAVRIGLIGLAIFSGGIAVRALKSAFDRGHTRLFRALFFIASAASGTLAYLSTSLVFAERISPNSRS